MSIKRKSRIYSRQQLKENAAALIFFAPFGILFLIFVIWPVISAIYYSFTTFSVVQDPIWVGLKNYKYLITQDNVFLKAMTNTLAMAFFSGLLGFVFSFLVAWAIDGVKGKMFFALAFYAPSITSGIAMSVVWLYFFSPDSYGFINNILIQNGIIDSPLLWTKDPSLILFIVIVVSTWMGMGNGFLAFLSGFQNLQGEIMEAAHIDGVNNRFQELIYVILPQMKPMLLFAAVNTVSSSFAVYDVPMTLAGSPGPENASLTLVGHMNDYAFNRLDYGYASTVAVVLFLITFLFGRLMFRILASKK